MSKTAKHEKSTKVSETLLNISVRKLAVGLVLGGFLILIFTLQLTNVLDFFFIRWEYIFPPLVALYFLSVQPYLNYADAKTYFWSGARIGGLLAIVILTLNIFYEFITQTGFVLGNEPLITTLSYTIFIISYAVVGGLSHYLFNRNVDSSKADVYKYNYVGSSLVIGAFTFVLSALAATAADGNPQIQSYYLLVPLVISTYFVIQSHNLPARDFTGGMYLGALFGALLSVVFGAIYFILLLVNLATNTAALEVGSLLMEALVVAVVVGVGYTFVAAAMGLFMKFFDRAL